MRASWSELTISISDVTLSDEGFYTCSLFTMPVRTAKAYLTVLGKRAIQANAKKFLLDSQEMEKKFWLWVTDTFPQLCSFSSICLVYHSSKDFLKLQNCLTIIYRTDKLKTGVTVTLTNFAG